MEEQCMAIGERIRFFRLLHGMTQKWLGGAIGFSEKTADIRMAQYESGARTPKENVVGDLAGIFKIDPRALTVPDIDTDIGLMHTLFTLEDTYGLVVNEIDGRLCLTLNKNHKEYSGMFDRLSSWKNEASKCRSGEITKEEYDEWRYNYPALDKSGMWVKVPSEELSDALVNSVKSK
jgi:transcriptional regulator with XRE-family HTH domain